MRISIETSAGKRATGLLSLLAAAAGKSVARVAGYYSMATLVILGSILGAAGVAYGQTEVQVYGTGMKDMCPNNELAFASISTQLNDSARTSAEALCLILIPEGDAPVKRMFCSYKFATGQMLRDDDNQGAPAPKLYKPESLNTNLTNFFKSLGCSASGDLTAKVAGEMKTIIGVGNLSAQELISRFPGIGSSSKKNLPNSLNSFLPSMSIEAFPLTVHGHLERLKSFSSPAEGETRTTKSERTIRDLETALNNEKARADKLQGELDNREGASGYNWIWVVAALGISLLGMVYGFKWLYSKMNRGMKEQREGFDQEGEIKDKIYSGLIQDLHRNSQPATTTKELLGGVEWFEQGLQDIEDGVEMSFADEDQMRSIFKDDLSKIWDELHRILPAEIQERPNELEKVENRLTRIFENHLKQFQTLRTHKDEIKARYHHLHNLSHGFCQFTSKILITNPLREGPESEGIQNDHSGSGRRNSGALPPPSQTEALARELDKRVAGLTLNTSSGGILHELDSLIHRLREIHDRIAPDKNISLVETVKIIQSELDRRAQDLKQFQRQWELITKTEQNLRNKSLMESGEEFFHCVERMAFDQKSSLDLLRDYGTRNALRIGDKVKEIGYELSLARKVIKEEIPEAEGTVAQLATKAIGELRQERKKAGQAEILAAEKKKYEDMVKTLTSEVQAGKELSGTLVQYLGFNPKMASSDEPSRMILAAIRSESPEYKELRHRLRAVQIALDRAAKRPDHERVIRALWVDEWLPHLNTFLAQMQDLRDDELWAKGLYLGFTKQWLHHLLRAELLMNAYFSDNESYFTLRDAVSQAGRAVIATMHNYGVKAQEVKMFAPPPDDVRPEANADPQLRELPEVRARIVQRYRESGLTGFVIDVMTFPLSMRGEQSSGRVVLMNPNNWLQNEKSD